VILVELEFDAQAADRRDPMSDGWCDLIACRVGGVEVKTDHQIEFAATKLIEIVLEKQIQDHEPDRE